MPFHSDCFLVGNDANMTRWKEAVFSQVVRLSMMVKTVRSSNWRYNEWRTFDSESKLMERELFNMVDDPMETINLAEDKAYDKVLQEMKSKLHNGWAEI